MQVIKPYFVEWYVWLPGHPEIKDGETVSDPVADAEIRTREFATLAAARKFRDREESRRCCPDTGRPKAWWGEGTHPIFRQWFDEHGMVDCEMLTGGAA